MSNYTAPAIHPETGVIQDAEWIDDYYGPHRYGVRFSDGKVFDSWLVKRPSRPVQIGATAVGHAVSYCYELMQPPLTDCLRRVIEQQ